MAVDTFDPSALSNPLNSDEIQALCALARALDSDVVVLADADVQRFAPLAAHSQWPEHLDGLDDDDINALIRLFTLGEMQYSSWLAGDKSPVVPLVRALKQRGSYTVETTRWIKAHTTNKFLPHGSLMARL